MKIHVSGARTGAWRRHLRLIGVAMSLFVLGLTGCGPGSAPADFGLDDHSDLTIASTASGGGALTIEYDFSRPVEVPFSQCIGGSGSACDGGILLYAAEDPGFGPLETNEEDESLFVLEEGTQVFLELTVADQGASYFINGTTLTRVGDSVLLGEAVEGVHVHGAWQIAVEAGAALPESLSLGFKLTAPASGYDASGDFTITLVPTADETGD